MKPRTLLTAREVEAVRAVIARRLDRVAVETQPEIAAAVLDLSSNADAGLACFARVIRTDSALAARVLRQANTAYFRQAEPVADVDRACVVLGTDRLRALALGFTLDRADPQSAERRLARRVWRHSIMRACIAQALCERVAERHAPAAFAAGLLLDASQPILARLLGPPAIDILGSDMPPHVAYAAEHRCLPFTHIDVAAVLCERWRLPAPLARAIEHHHSPPPAPSGLAALRDEESVLRRIAHIAGLIELDDRSCTPRAGDWLPQAAERTLGLSAARLSGVLLQAQRDFARVRLDLEGVSAAATDLPALHQRLQQQVDRAVDQMLAGVLRRDDAEAPKALRLGGRIVEIERRPDGRWCALLIDSLGDRLAVHEIAPGDDVPALLQSLALKPAPGDQLDALSRILGMVA